GAILEGNTLASWVGWTQGIPTAIEEATTTVRDRSFAVRSLVRLLGRHSNCVISVSEAIGTTLRKQGVPSQKIRVIPNGVHDSGVPDCHQSRHARQALGIPPEAYVVGSVGRLSEDVKRFSDILTAVSL